MSSGSEVIATLRERGFVQQINDEAGLIGLLGKGPVTYYAGFDPTRQSLQLGNSVPLLAMAHLARAGHRPIGVLGGGTSMIGDPSGKTEMRQMMTPETIAENRKGVEAQVRRYLSAAGDNAIVVDNGDWLLSIKYIDFLREVGRHFSVNRMLAAEGYRQRMERGLSFIEFNYQLLQAYDFLVLRRQYGCLLQIGGDDQWGNILAGTDLIRRMDQVEAYALTFPLITTAAGAKMGKTADGAVWLSAEMTSPFDFYQYFVNVDDRDVERFLKLFTFLALDEIARYAALGGAEIREAKAALAFHATAVVHGEEVARSAQDAARAAFGGGGAGDSVPTHELSSSAVGAGLKVIDVLAASGLAASKSAARRLIEQGGVRLGERKIGSLDDVVTTADDGALLHAGKKHIRRLVVK